MKLYLETERLNLRPFAIEDASDMFSSWTSDDEVSKYLTWNTHKSVEETKALLSLWVEQYEKKERINLAITLKSNGELIGGIDVVGYLDNVPVIGYAISRKHWNKGYTTEATKCLLAYLFSMGYEKVRIDAVKENIGSLRVIEKCGGILINTVDEFIRSKNITQTIKEHIVTKESFNN